MILFLQPDEYDHVWCRRCELVHSTGAWAQHDECPDCRAPLKEAYPWLPDEGPRDVHPEYPEVPNVGCWYPDETPPDMDRRLIGTNPRDWKGMMAPDTGTASRE